MAKKNIPGPENLLKVLQEGEKQYKTLLNNIPQKIFYKDLDSIYVLCNESYARDLKIEPSLIKGKTDYDFYPKNLAEKYRADDKKIMKSGKKAEFDEEYMQDGKAKTVHTFKAPVKDKKGNTIGVFGIFWDITDKRRAEEDYLRSSARYKLLFEHSPVSIWEEDLSEVKQFIDRLRERGVKDIKEYFDAHPEDVAHCATMVKVIDINRATIRLYKAKSKDDFWGGLSRIFTKESYEYFKKAIISIAEGQTQTEFQCVNQTLRGTKIFVNLRWMIAPGFEKTWSRVIVTITNITDATRTKRKLEHLNKELVKTNKKLEQLVVKDAHTDLFNRRYLEDIIDTEFHRAKRYGYPLSVVLIDIDYFRSINEVYGNQFGDLVLKQFAKQLKNIVRKYDILIRLAGEEFAVISPRADIDNAKTVAQRVLDAITLYNFGNKTYAVKLKVSLAVSSFPEDVIAKPMDLIATAGKILARGKEKGGNRVYTSNDVKLTKEISPKTTKDVNIEFLRKKIEKLDRRAKMGLTEAIYAFTKAIELKDATTGSHVEKTVEYAVGIAREMNLAKEDIERIEKAAILHDLGKIGISEKILNKKGKLTKEEYHEIERHPQIAADIIKPIQHLHDIIPLILFHHERWDGKGYPRGLKGEETPIGARIIAVADAYQALTSLRPYRKAYSEKKAIAIIKKAAGKNYDPYIVSAFLNILEKEK